MLTRRTMLSATLAAGIFGSTAAMWPRPKPLRILILGGTYYVGPALVRAAVARGHRVTIFNRGITRPHLFHNLERLRGNRFPEIDNGLGALAKGEWDVVFDVPAYYPRLVEATASLLQNRVARYVMVSSIAAYSDWSIVGMTESAPVHRTGSLPAFEEAVTLKSGGAAYGVRKVACEQAVARHFGQRCATVRATGIFGAGIEDDDPNKFFWPARLALGRPILAPGDGRQLLQSIDVRDLAEFLLHLAETDQMGVFNAIGPDVPFTTGEYVQAARAVTGGSAEVIWSGEDFGDFPMYNDSVAFSSFDPSKAKRAGLRYRSLVDSVQSNWDWFRKNYSPDFDFNEAGIGMSKAAEQEGLARAKAKDLW